MSFKPLSLLLFYMLYDMSLLLRPYLVGFLISQPLSAVLLHMAHLATVMACDDLQTLGCILTTALSFLLGPLAFALYIGYKASIFLLNIDRGSGSL